MDRRAFIWGSVGLALTGGHSAMAEDFVQDTGRTWSYLSDQVMGGVSEGAAQVVSGTIRLSGTVSTENRGGFIQVRTQLNEPLPPKAQGLEIEARGNGERYFIHLRTTGTRLPWQYYQASFETTSAWATTRLPFASFRPSGALLRPMPKAQSVQSIGLVAYGRDHAAYVELRSLTTYAAE